MALKFASAWMLRDAEFDRAFISFARDMESRRSLEHRAAIIIQVAWRKYTMRQWRKFLDQQATTIQRVVRGHHSRQHTLQMLHARAAANLAAYHYAMATRIQSLWRGYTSRKHAFDYYARKRYLAQLALKSDQVRAQLDAYERTQRLVFAQELKDKIKAKQAKVARKVHHLLGTYSVPGVLAPAERRPPPPTVKHPALHVHRPLSPTVRAKLPPRWVDDTTPAPHTDEASPIKRFGHLSPQPLPGTSYQGSHNEDLEGEHTSGGPLAASKMYLSSRSDLMLYQPYTPARPALALGQKEMRLLALAEHVLTHERALVQRAYAEEAVRRATQVEVRRKFAPETRLGRFGKLAPLVGGEKALVVDSALGEGQVERVVPEEWRVGGKRRGKVGTRRETEAVGV